MTQNPGQWGPQGGYPPQGQGGYPPAGQGGYPPPQPTPGFPPQQGGLQPTGHVRAAGRLTRRKARPAATGSSPRPAGTVSRVRCRRRAAASRRPAGRQPRRAPA